MIIDSTTNSPQLHIGISSLEERLEFIVGKEANCLVAALLEYSGSESLVDAGDSFLSDNIDNAHEAWPEARLWLDLVVNQLHLDSLHWRDDGDRLGGASAKSTQQRLLSRELSVAVAVLVLEYVEDREANGALRDRAVKQRGHATVEAADAVLLYRQTDTV